jgi:hypothetical protein
MDTNVTDAAVIADLPDGASISQPESERAAYTENNPDIAANGAAAGLAPHEDDRLIAATAKPRKGRKRLLLAGVVVVAIGGIGLAGFLLSPWYRVHPVPRIAPPARHVAASGGIAQPAPQPVSPASVLAGAAAPQPVAPPLRDRPGPTSRQAEVAEVQSLGGIAGQPTAGAPQQPGPEPPDRPAHKSRSPDTTGQPETATQASPEAAASAKNAPTTPAVIPGELGMPPMVVERAGAQTGGPVAHSELAPTQPGNAFQSNAQPGSTAGRTADASHNAPSPPDYAAAPAAPAKPTITSDASASPSDQTGTPPQHAATQHAAPTTGKSDQDPATQAAHLVAAPLAMADQIKVVNMVAEVAAMVRDLKIEEAGLRSDLQKSSGEASAELADLQRRVSLIEAGRAIDAARKAGQPPSPAAPAPDAQASAATGPVRLMRAEAALSDDAGDPAKRVRYHVQAASPGLAMLAEIDRSGGDGSELQVAVGDALPGYGKVKSIGQVGARWVVTTEHGTIGN